MSNEAAQRGAYEASPSDVRLDVEHVTYNVGTVDSLDENLRTCLPSHRDALLDARTQHYPAVRCHKCENTATHRATFVGPGRPFDLCTTHAEAVQRVYAEKVTVTAKAERSAP